MSTKILTLALVAGVLAGLVGCNQTATTQQGDKVLKLTPPGKTNIEQGGTAKFKVSIKREKFDDPVTVDIKNLPEGVTVEDGGRKFDKGETDHEFTLKAADDAKVQDGHKSTVTATGPGTLKTSEDVTINVTKKK